ncbi:MAG: ferritin family protein [Thermoplasmata archaeon]
MKEVLDSLSFKEIIGYSVKAEENAYEFYMKLSEKAKSGIVSSRYVSLANDEKMHKKELLKLHEKLFGDRNIEVPGHEGLPPHEGDVKLETVRNLMEALDAAIESERNAYKIYSYLAEKQPGHNKLFSYLALMEKGHASSLSDEKSLYQGVVNTKPEVTTSPYEVITDFQIQKATQQ